MSDEEKETDTIYNASFVIINIYEDGKSEPHVNDDVWRVHGRANREKGDLDFGGIFCFFSSVDIKTMMCDESLEDTKGCFQFG